MARDGEKPRSRNKKIFNTHVTFKRDRYVKMSSPSNEYGKKRKES